MHKTDLIDAIAQRLRLDRQQVAATIDAFTAVVTYTVASGEDVVLTGFGKWTRAHKPARTARNPRTGEPVQVPETWAPKFKAGTDLKEAAAMGSLAAAKGGTGVPAAA